MTVQQRTWNEDSAEVWQLFKETDARFKATDARFKATDARFKATDAQFRATDARLDARFKETDEQFKATDERFKQTDRQIKELSALFTDQWGKMVEALVEPSALQLFQDRGIDVHYTYRRVEAQLNGRQMELDLLLENSDEVVVIEVKSNLRVGDVNEFLETLTIFPEFFPRYREYKIYGGVAGLMFSEESNKYAYRKGLFVLSATGDGIAQIQNDMTFHPKNFAHD